MRFALLLALLAAPLAACADATPPAASAPAASAPAASPDSLAPPAARPDTALFAMGCFWCAETAFEGVPGVRAVVSGFTDGTVPNPTYDQVTRGGTGHAEAVQVVFDPARIGYATLLRIFWHNVDPFDAGGQFCDRGDSYRSGLYPRGAAQRRAAEASKAAVEARFGRRVATEIADATPFYPAEEYHQDFWRKDPARYTSYRQGCGRDARLRTIWGADALRAGDAI